MAKDEITITAGEGLDLADLLEWAAEREGTWDMPDNERLIAKLRGGPPAGLEYVDPAERMDDARRSVAAVAEFGLANEAAASVALDGATQYDPDEEAAAQAAYEADVKARAAEQGRNPWSVLIDDFRGEGD